MRVCSQCGREYNPSSRHLKCPICRYQKVPCACGKPKHRGSVQCIECHNEKQVGEANPNWKGGRWRTKSGYIYLPVPNHPRGYRVFEHILVMENILGRHLLPGETVHHLNGVRDDNRPENLELWTKPQPTGIRVSDAIAWAREILARYVDDEGVEPSS